MPKPLPIHYRIHIVPDLEQFDFEGSIVIELQADEPIHLVALNVLELAVRHCRFQQRDEWIDCSFLVDPQSERLEIHLPQAVSGRLVLHLEYHGHINDQLAGFYRSRYVKNGKLHTLAITQFQESDARRAFPCMDHPRQKATFDITIDAPAGMTALSNCDIREETLLENGKKRIVFNRTPRMSTYLVFFGVGAFAFKTDAKDPRIRVVAPLEIKDTADAALVFGRKALQYCEAYYGIAYPLPKLDLIAVPDFAFGAMENWGAITFRENLLLYDPEKTAKSGLKRIYEVIAHEIAHQWFGNLVTPVDWKYLWLNESFATYFGSGVVAHHEPDWEIWEQFLDVETAAAMGRDALHETFPIEIPGGEHVVINTSTAPIIYNKGGSILRQMHGYIGEEAFQEGLRRYLNTYANANAASRHLWESFESISGLPVTGLLENWIGQPGFPVVDAEGKGDRILLRQRRFTYLPNESSQLWKIPISIQCFSENAPPRLKRLLMETRETEAVLPAGTSAFKVNAGQSGFFRVRYRDAENVRHLLSRISDESLSTEDRWGIEEDAFAFCLAGETSFSTYLEMVDLFHYETAYLPLSGIIGNLMFAHRTLGGDYHVPIAQRARPLCERILDRTGREPQSDEPMTTAILREQAIWCAAIMGSERTIAFALNRFHQMMSDGQKMHPDLSKCIMQVGAYSMDDAQVFDWFKRRLASADNEHERMNILIAFGSFRNPEIIRKMLDFVLESVPPRNQFIPVAAIAANPDAGLLLWQWYAENLDRIERFHPILYERVVAAVIPSAGMKTPEEVESFFSNYIKKRPRAADVIRLSLERLKLNDRFRTINTHP